MINTWTRNQANSGPTLYAKKPKSLGPGMFVLLLEVADHLAKEQRLSGIIFIERKAVGSMIWMVDTKVLSCIRWLLNGATSVLIIWNNLEFQHASSAATFS